MHIYGDRFSNIGGFDLASGKGPGFGRKDSFPGDLGDPAPVGGLGRFQVSADLQAELDAHRFAFEQVDNKGDFGLVEEGGRKEAWDPNMTVEFEAGYPIDIDKQLTALTGRARLADTERNLDTALYYRTSQLHNEPTEGSWNLESIKCFEFAEAKDIVQGLIRAFDPFDEIRKQTEFNLEGFERESRLEVWRELEEVEAVSKMFDWAHESYLEFKSALEESDLDEKAVEATILNIKRSFFGLAEKYSLRYNQAFAFTGLDDFQAALNFIEEFSYDCYGTSLFMAQSLN